MPTYTAVLAPPAPLVLVPLPRRTALVPVLDDELEEEPLRVDAPLEEPLELEDEDDVEPELPEDPDDPEELDDPDEPLEGGAERTGC